MIPNCFGLTADLFTGYTFPFYHHHQVPSTSSRLAIMDLLFLRSMIKLWVHGGVPFYITQFFFFRYSLSTSKDCFKYCAQISFVKITEL